jgi:agmatine deiminase
MVTRRTVLQSLGILGAGALLGTGKESLAVAATKAGWVMPDEGDPHKRTWMAFGASAKVWGRRLLPEVQRNLATIALTIARYEPVSMLVRQEDLAVARKLMGDKIDLIVFPLDDLWMRDTGPVFVVNEKGEKAGVDFNFNGWGEKQTFSFIPILKNNLTK